MKINKYIRTLLFCIGTALLLFVLHFIQTTWFETMDTRVLTSMVSIIVASELMLKILKKIKEYEIENERDFICTNKVMQCTVFVVGLFLLTVVSFYLLHLLFMNSRNQDVIFSMLLMLSVYLMCILERKVYDFDTTHNGDVTLRKKW